MLRSILDYRRLSQWEASVLNRGVKKESRFAALVRKVPWGGVGMILFCLIFFGIDVSVGVKQIASQLKENKEAAMNHPAVVEHQQRQWSIEQVKSFREGKSQPTTAKDSA